MEWYQDTDIANIETAMRTKGKEEVLEALANLHGDSQTDCGRVYYQKDEKLITMCKTCSSFSLALFQVTDERNDLVVMKK